MSATCSSHDHHVTILTTPTHQTSHLEVDNQNECTRGSVPHRLIVPLITTRHNIEDCEAIEDKEDDDSSHYTLDQTENKDECIEAFVLLPSDVQLRELQTQLFIDILGGEGGGGGGGEGCSQDEEEEEDVKKESKNQ